MIDVNSLIDFEMGAISEVDEIKLFSGLVKTGMAWKLQGFYGRHAQELISSNVIDVQGNILVNLAEIH